jgi:hypothetical protein
VEGPSRQESRCGNGVASPETETTALTTAADDGESIPLKLRSGANEL